MTVRSGFISRDDLIREIGEKNARTRRSLAIFRMCREPMTKLLIDVFPTRRKSKCPRPKK